MSEKSTRRLATRRNDTWLLKDVVQHKYIHGMTSSCFPCITSINHILRCRSQKVYSGKLTKLVEHNKRQVFHHGQEFIVQNNDYSPESGFTTSSAFSGSTAAPARVSAATPASGTFTPTGTARFKKGMTAGLNHDEPYDILLGDLGDYISEPMLTFTFNEHHQLVMIATLNDLTSVRLEVRREADRRHGFPGYSLTTRDRAGLRWSMHWSRCCSAKVWNQRRGTSPELRFVS